MSNLYSAEHRALQDKFDSRRLADALENNVVRYALAEMDKKFIASADMFFLGTIDANGFPSVSYKGGDPGFVKIVDDRTLAIPYYDGNGMFYSAGNVGGNSKLGLLFIDLEKPRRLRLHGTGELVSDGDELDRFPGAKVVMRIHLQHIFTNCPRYIHRYRKLARSEYVPKAGIAPPDPEWKRVDYLQDALPSDERERMKAKGPAISEAEYRKNFWRGL
jgi:predicted pyridoxine 5'-phosphate oxidase superfamily flavin-nucleotide-binding protein